MFVMFAQKFVYSYIFIFFCRERSTSKCCKAPKRPEQIEHSEQINRIKDLQSSLIELIKNKLEQIKLDIDTYTYLTFTRL